MALTIRKIESAKPKDQKYKLADGDGLCLLIQPWGGKFWLWRYRFDGTEKNMTFGGVSARRPQGPANFTLMRRNCCFPGQSDEPYDFAEDVAAYFVGDDENNQQIPDDVLA